MRSRGSSESSRSSLPTETTRRVNPGRSITSREREVLRLVCDGHSSRAIAGILGISVHTVGVHRQKIMKSLGVRKVAELVMSAIRLGLVSVGPPSAMCSCGGRRASGVNGAES